MLRIASAPRERGLKHILNLTINQKWNFALSFCGEDQIHQRLRCFENRRRLCFERQWYRVCESSLVVICTSFEPSAVILRTG